MALPAQKIVQEKMRWHRFVWSGIALVVGFFGLINLASLFSQHGFVWHTIFHEEIAEYQKTIYPIYDFALAPIALFFHIHLTRFSHDVITAFVLAFCAANTESMLRDGRPLLMSLLSLVTAPLVIFREKSNRTSYEEDRVKVENRVGQIQTFLTKQLPPVKRLLYPAFTIGTVINFCLLIFLLARIPGGIFSLLPQNRIIAWFSWAIHHFWYTPIVCMLLGVIIGAFNGAKASQHRKLAAALALLIACVGLVTFYVAFPYFIMLMLFLAAVFLLTLAEIMVILAIISPLIAWRTCLTTLIVFSMLMLLNWGMMHGFV